MSERKAGDTKGKDLEREGGITHQDDWEAPSSLATGDLPTGSQLGSGPVRLDPTPARLTEGGGSDIAIGDPGVNGN